MTISLNSNALKFSLSYICFNLAAGKSWGHALWFNPMKLWSMSDITIDKLHEGNDEMITKQFPKHLLPQLHSTLPRNEAQDCDSISHLATKRTFRYGATHSLQHCTFIFCSLGTWMSCRFSFSEDKYDVETCAQPDKDTFGCMWERFVKCCSSIPIPFLDRVSPRLTLREEVCRQQILESEKFRRRNILEALRTLICSKELFGSQIYYF